MKITAVLKSIGSSKWMSRKLLVLVWTMWAVPWLVQHGMGQETIDHLLNAVLVFLGVQGGADIAAAWKSGMKQ